MGRLCWYVPTYGRDPSYWMDWLGLTCSNHKTWLVVCAAAGLTSVWVYHHYHGIPLHRWTMLVRPNQWSTSIMVWYGMVGYEDHASRWQGAQSSSSRCWCRLCWYVPIYGQDWHAWNWGQQVQGIDDVSVGDCLTCCHGGISLKDLLGLNPSVVRCKHPLLTIVFDSLVEMLKFTNAFIWNKKLDLTKLYDCKRWITRIAYRWGTQLAALLGANCRTRRALELLTLMAALGHSHGHICLSGG